MRRALFIAYYFPPCGGAGVQRSAKFARYLSAVGWTPAVVTRPVGSESDFAPIDASLCPEVADVEVHRLEGPEPPPHTGWRGRADRWLRLRHPFASWWVEGVQRAAVRAQPFDLIYASCSPFESAVAAMRLARRTGTPWVVDLRDPWALNEMIIFPTRLHRWFELRRMGRVLRAADAVVVNTPEARKLLLARFPALRSRPVSVIPNGWDAADFAAPAPERSDDRFRIVHAGYLHVAMGRSERRRRLLRRVLGGSVPVDVLTRSHVFLMGALDLLAGRRPDLAPLIDVRFAGPVTPEVREVAEGRSVSVTFLGSVAHADSVALVRSADLLFLPMQNLANGRRASITPGKTYEYLASGRPILAAVPSGDTRDLLVRAGNALIADPADSAGMSRLIEEAVERARAGRRVPPPDPAVLARYERRALTAELADVFTAVAARSPSRAEADGRRR
ncbi:MAG: glycosyltransferase family 4 protein [Actinomycetota bacterium]